MAVDAVCDRYVLAISGGFNVVFSRAFTSLLLLLDLATVRVTLVALDVVVFCKSAVLAVLRKGIGT